MKKTNILLFVIVNVVHLSVYINTTNKKNNSP